MYPFLETKTSWNFETCPPENECQNGHHTCDPKSQVCVDTIEGYDCICSQGYQEDEFGICQPQCSQVLHEIHWVYKWDTVIWIANFGNGTASHHAWKFDKIENIKLIFGLFSKIENIFNFGARISILYSEIKFIFSVHFLCQYIPSEGVCMI